LSALAHKVPTRGAIESAQAEVLRELGDVFKELAHLSTDLGAVWRSLEETKQKLDAQATLLIELVDGLHEQLEFGDESTELLGRLVQSTRARVDRLERLAGETGGGATQTET
jgi:hypothetical protein